MRHDLPTDHSPKRREALLAGGAGLAAASLTACGSADGTAAGTSTTAASGGSGGSTTLAKSDVPEGGGVVIKDAKVVVTQPSAGEFKAFSAVCTHQGCEISEWVPKDQTLMCYCHFSKFSPGRAGEVMAGPAPRTLPLLPLKEVDGVLVVAGPFTARPGVAKSA